MPDDLGLPAGMGRYDTDTVQILDDCFVHLN